MRISTTQLYNDATRNMLEGQSRLADIQGKIASGKNSTRLADDPVAANQVVSLKRELAQLDMFSTNIDATRRRLALEETTLRDYDTALDRARVLSIQAGNSTLTDLDRKAISFELEELVAYMAGLMNTQDSKGEYLFSGSKGTTAAYALQNGQYTYQGDSGNREIQISSGVFLDSTDAGEYIFESIVESPAVLANGALTSALTNYTITNPDAYQLFMRSVGDIQFSVARIDPDNTDPTSTGLVYSLTDSAGRPITSSDGTLLSAVPYTDAEAEPQEITFNLPGIDLAFTLPSSASFPLDMPVLTAGAGEPQNVLTNYDITNTPRFLGSVNGLSLEVSNNGDGTFDYSLRDADNNVLNDVSADPALPIIATNQSATTLTVDLPGAENLIFDLAVLAPTAGTTATATWDVTPAEAEPVLELTGEDRSILADTQLLDARKYSEYMLDNGPLALSVEYDAASGYSWSISNREDNIQAQGRYLGPQVGTLRGYEVTADQFPMDLSTNPAQFGFTVNGVESTRVELSGSYNNSSELVAAVQLAVSSEALLGAPSIDLQVSFDNGLIFTVADALTELNVIDTNASSDTNLGLASNELSETIAAMDMALSLKLPTNQQDYDATLRYQTFQSASLKLEQIPSNPLNAILATINSLRSPIQGDTDARGAFDAQIALMLDQMSTAQEKINESVAKIGGRMNVLDSAEFSNDDFRLSTEGTLSAIEDLDYAAASTELAKRQLALEASYASFAKIQGLSLFNYIN